MGRLIDTDILIAELKESALHHCNNPREDSLLQRDRVIVRAQPTVEAIPKDQYENRLRADMVAVLEEISLKFDEQYYINRHELHDDSLNRGLEQGQDIIQQKINTLKGENETC